jgi:hypothetical protein
MLEFACGRLDDPHHTNKATYNLLGEDSFVIHYFSFYLLNKSTILFMQSVFKVVHVDTPDNIYIKFVGVITAT